MGWGDCACRCCSWGRPVNVVDGGGGTGDIGGGGGGRVGGVGGWFACAAGGRRGWKQCRGVGWPFIPQPTWPRPPLSVRRLPACRRLHGGGAGSPLFQRDRCDQRRVGGRPPPPPPAPPHSTHGSRRGHPCPRCAPRVARPCRQRERRSSEASPPVVRGGGGVGESGSSGACRGASLSIPMTSEKPHPSVPFLSPVSPPAPF